MNDLDQLRKQLEAFRQANQVEIFITAEDGQTQLPLRLRKVSIEDLVFAGKIPDSLSGIITKMLTDTGDGDEEKVDLSKLDMSEMGELFDIVLMACTQWPPLARVGNEENFGTDEIPFEVKDAVFSWVNGEALALEPFRAQLDRNGTPAQLGKELRPSSE
ncbi:MAG: hypothetical protein KC441_03095 [Anaerolineales bacterium]|nr:hypothetical protein [Anaerolineales bacterium]